jgi:hypothetical protein
MTGIACPPRDAITAFPQDIIINWNAPVAFNLSTVERANVWRGFNGA